VLFDAATYSGMRVNGAKRPPGAIGLSVGRDAQRRVQVIGVLPGGPAEGAGVKVGDRIIRIGDEPAAALTLEDVVARFAGAIGSGVDLHVERAGTRGPQKIHVERAAIGAFSLDQGPRILTTPAGAGPPPAKVGYFHLKHLGWDASDAVGRALEDFARQRVGGIVVDLRGNGGGLYQQAIHVADAFVKHGTLASMVGVGGTQRKDEEAIDSESEPDVPIAVLVDHDTASGAEIVAAALRAQDRAIILGQHTVGMGTVQVLFDIASPLASPPDSESPAKLGLKLTTAQFLSPGDVPIQLRGVTPDIELRGVTVTRVGQRTLFRTEQPASMRTEGAYERPLAASGAQLQAERSLMTLDYLSLAPTSEPNDSEVIGEARAPVGADDAVAAIAAELVARIRQPGRAAALAVARTVVPELAAREDARIAAAAASLKIDWSSGARTAAPRLALKIDSRSGETVRAGTDAHLRGTVTNSGSAPAFRVRAVLASDDPTFDEWEMPLGRVAPGESKTFDLAVPIPATAFTRTDLVRARLREMGGDVAGGAADTMIALEAQPMPALSFTCRAIEAKSHGKVPGTKSINLVMRIRNQGTAAVERAEATLRRSGGAAGDDDGVVFRVSRWSGTLAAGAEKEATFVVDLPATSHGGSMDLDLAVNGPLRYDAVSAHMRISAGPDASWQVTPPSVSATPPLVKVTAPVVAAGNTVHVAGEVHADTAARDVYIRVWNRSLKIPVRKVFYQNAAANSAQLSFETDVPIWPGSNLVTVSARDAAGTEATRFLVVLRKE
jgi:carboxyl-terminal processing protease